MALLTILVGDTAGGRMGALSDMAPNSAPEGRSTDVPTELEGVT